MDKIQISRLFLFLWKMWDVGLSLQLKSESRCRELFDRHFKVALVSFCGKILEGVLILRNSSLKHKTVVDNAILLNCAVSPENISKSIKIQTENDFRLK